MILLQFDYIGLFGVFLILLLVMYVIATESLTVRFCRVFAFESYRGRLFNVFFYITGILLRRD